MLLKSLFILGLVYIVLDILNYIILKFVKKVDVGNYFDFIKKQYFANKNKNNKVDSKSEWFLINSAYLTSGV